MKNFRIMKVDHTNGGQTFSFVAYRPAVDAADAGLNALNEFWWGYYVPTEVPGPIPATYSPSGAWYGGLRF